MRLGVFGGTFDPVHLGHLIMAEQCRVQAELDRVLFVPAARPPHKLEQPLTTFDKRVEMLELAIAGYPKFQISLMEKDRPGPSYTIDTLRALRSEHADAELFLLLGADCLPDLPSWHEPEQIAQLATLVLVPRPGVAAPPAATPFQIQRLSMPAVDISSSSIRGRVAEGKSIRYLTPRAVECYIETHKLYAIGKINVI